MAFAAPVLSNLSPGIRTMVEPERPAAANASTAMRGGDVNGESQAGPSGARSLTSSLSLHDSASAAVSAGSTVNRFSQDHRFVVASSGSVPPRDHSPS